MSIQIMRLFAFSLFLASLLAPGPSAPVPMPGIVACGAARETSRPGSGAGEATTLPWVFPGDFRERLRMSDLVVAGTIERTSADAVRTVDGVEVAANIARLSQ